MYLTHIIQRFTRKSRMIQYHSKLLLCTVLLSNTIKYLIAMGIRARSYPNLIARFIQGVHLTVKALYWCTSNWYAIPASIYFPLKTQLTWPNRFSSIAGYVPFRRVHFKRIYRLLHCEITHTPLNITPGIYWIGAHKQPKITGFNAPGFIFTHKG